MRHPIEGTPFVPPNPICPVYQEGSLPDLTTTPFELNIDVYGNDTYYSVVFGNADTSEEDTGIYDADFVETAMPAVPSDSELARQLHAIAGLEGIEKSASAAISNTEHPVAERMRLNFCDRVADCQGIVNGECWALGRTAMKEVLEEVSQDQD